MNNRNKIINNVSIIGIFTNLFLLIIKFIAGFISGSNALIADTFHSIQDMLSSILSVIGAKISAKKPNIKYSFGFGKAEYIFSFLIGIAIFVTALSLLVNSIKSIILYQVVEFSYMSILVCIITIIIKISLYIYTNCKYKKTHSILINSIKEDHKNDIYISIATLIGIFFSYFGITFVDSILAIAISVLLAMSGCKMFLSSIEVLMDKNMNQNKIIDIKNEIFNYQEVLCINKFDSKPIGNKYILMISLCINNYNDIKYINETVNRIKQNIKYKFEDVYELYIEVDNNLIEQK